ncbi:hypothetical protein D9756_008894 [Leucocoprinus leucothites]|uniref:F-box domain-containing protein n=1 Tax=Leucocoprinus leucothites TaxID=201217 RepID=A0A8H5CXJ3_9AGAR|nr:hypothetical protein D9756_008894 [Leucoagaricus leucothites]
MPPSSPLPPVLSPKEIEVDSLNATLSQLAVETQLIVTKRAQCLRRLNELSAATTILPSEMLSNIFEHVCSEPMSSPVALGAVCSYWRDVAWANPSLWNSFNAKFALGGPTIPRRTLDLLDLHFTNAKSIPVTVLFYDEPDVSCHSPPNQPSIPFQNLLEYIFRDNPQKLGGFVMDTITDAWWHFVCDLVQPGFLTRLRRLELGATPSSHHRHRPFFSVSTLTKLSLHENVEIESFPWSQLTHLELFGVDKDVCFSLLLQCTSLMEYRCHKPKITYSRNYAHLLDSNKVTFTRLHTLEWCFQDDEWSHFLLASMAFPSLRHLHCSPRNSNVRGSSSFWRLMDNFIGSLTRLKTFHGDICFFWDAPKQCDHDDNAPFNEAFRSLDLEELHLQHGDIRGLRFVFRQLSLADSPFLPRLRLISIEGKASRLDWCLNDPLVYAPFIDFLVTRRDGDHTKWKQNKRLEVVRFRRTFHFKGTFSEVFHQLPAAEVDILKRLVEEGLHMEVVDTSGKSKA